MSTQTTPQPFLDAQCKMLDFLGADSDDFYFFLDFSNEHLYFSKNIRKACAVMEHGETFLTLQAWSQIVYPWDLHMLMRTIQAVQSGEQDRYDLSHRLIGRSGSVFWVRSRGQLLTDPANGAGWLMGSLSETAMSDHSDQLTGTFNMRYLKQEIGQLLSQEIPGFLLLAGVDNLKSINLKQGRDQGDNVLKDTAQALELATNGTRRIYRTNGDCFAVNLPRYTAQQVSDIFQKVQRQLNGRCTLSAGCVPYQEYMVPDAETLYQYAENTLDHAKGKGKNRLLFFSAEDYEKELTALELSESLTESVQADFRGFSLCYQPQVTSGRYRLYGAEALLRYTSPIRGPVSPAEFIPVLEQSKLICPVGIWVLDTALAQCRQWRRIVPDFHISVNMSYTQLCQDTIVQDVLDAVARSGLPGSALTIEITESMQLLDYPHINEIFLQWKQSGIEISVDDFGTGYSSLSRLKELAVDEIKIDRCFVNNIQHSVYNYRLLSNMLELADSCQIRVCCEGVETEAELTVLEELRPALLQGFLFSRPCTPEELERLYFEPNSPACRERVAKENAYRSQFHPALVAPAHDLSEEEIAKVILDAQTDVFYVSDPVTYELYYLNPAGQRLMGQRDYRGRKCYKVLQGLDEPCPFCTNHLLKQDQFYLWERENQYCDRRFLLKDKLISCGGRTMRMEVALDITKHELVSQSTQDRLNFAEKIAGYTRTLANHADYQEAVDLVLASAGQFYQADRAYLFEPADPNGDSWRNTFEWCAENIKSEMDNLQSLPRKAVSRWLDLFRQDKSVIILNLDALRKDAPIEWEILAPQGITRLIAVPVRDAEQTIGFIGVDNPRSSIQDDSQIRVLSSFLVHRIRQERNESRYQELLRVNYHDIFDRLGLGFWVIHLDPLGNRHEMLANDTMHRVLGISGVPSGEECYRHWYDRINEDYYHYVDQSVETMVQTWQPIQLEYTWKHPQRGEVMVRCTGLRMPDVDGKICLKGYHRIINDLTRAQFISDRCARDIFEYNEINRSIFFHTDRTLLWGSNTHEADFPQCWIDTGIVHPHFASAFRSLFSQLRSKEELPCLELLLKMKDGSYGWFVLIPQHLSWEQKDLDTIVVVLEPMTTVHLNRLDSKDRPSDDSTTPSSAPGPSD